MPGRKRKAPKEPEAPPTDEEVDAAKQIYTDMIVENDRLRAELRPVATEIRRARKVLKAYALDRGLDSIVIGERTLTLSTKTKPNLTQGTLKECPSLTTAQLATLLTECMTNQSSLTDTTATD
jgi:hypothetical protein